MNKSKNDIIICRAIVNDSDSDSDSDDEYKSMANEKTLKKVRKNIKLGRRYSFSNDVDKSYSYSDSGSDSEKVNSEDEPI